VTLPPAVASLDVLEEVPRLAVQLPTDRLERREAHRFGLAGLEDRGVRHRYAHTLGQLGDFSLGRIWALQCAEDGSVQTRELLDTELMIASFGEDDDGELYVVDFNGAVHRVMAE